MGKYKAELKEKYKEYAKRFSENVQQSMNKSTGPRKDMLFYEMGYLNSANTIYNLQRVFTLEAFKFWENMIKIEKHYCERLTFYYKEYIKFFRNYHLVPDFVDNFDVLEKQTLQYEAFLHPEDILSYDERNYIKKKLDMKANEKLNLKILRSFLHDDYSLKSLGSRPLIISEIVANRKRFSLYEKKTTNKNLNSKWRECMLIITAENNMIVVEDGASSQKVIKLGISTCKFNEKSFLIEINELIPRSFMFSYVKKHTYRFDNPFTFDSVKSMLKGLVKQV